LWLHASNKQARLWLLVAAETLRSHPPDILREKYPLTQFEKNRMSDNGSGSESFIVKVWVEEDTPAQTSFFRGRITHVQTGKLQYFDNPRVMLAFMMPFLRQIPASHPARWQERHSDDDVPHQ
jgi:hypothetical protein